MKALPDEEGIETSRAWSFSCTIRMKALPDEEGIETRSATAHTARYRRMKALPDEEGIETLPNRLIDCPISV